MEQRDSSRGAVEARPGPTRERERDPSKHLTFFSLIYLIVCLWSYVARKKKEEEGDGNNAAVAFVFFFMLQEKRKEE